ncbi:hypothetical protein KCP77_08520 [Salmonella enterica subsp. enterica]|nr:hypothetical protein KCP77_08520 [Salmonella enterica subsp. enterica]
MEKPECVGCDRRTPRRVVAMNKSVGFRSPVTQRAPGHRCTSTARSDKALSRRYPAINGESPTLFTQPVILASSR